MPYLCDSGVKPNSPPAVHDVKEKPRMVERAMLVGIQPPATDHSETRGLLDELRELVATLGIKVQAEQVIPIRKPQAKFLTGAGKAEAIIADAENRGCDVLVFDNELTPAQQRNWEQAAHNRLLVIDRQEVILDIFAGRARTREAVLQVELARLEYNLPRLKRAWTHLNRQRGGGAVQRDAGETQLELDQRMVRDKIAKVRRQLDQVIRQRKTQRKRRMAIPVPTCSVIGYTNAGKSSLVNALTAADIGARDQLFATLDPTSRKCDLPRGQHVVVSDTVGFIRNLPHRLVEAFKATLEEALLADFLIHVLDVTSAETEAHAETTMNVLRELGAGDKTIITVFNKVDALLLPETRDDLALKHPDAHFVSAATGEGVAGLLDHMERLVESERNQTRLLIPHDRYDLVARLHREGGIRKEEPRDDGTYLVGAVPQRLFPTVRPFLMNADHA